MEDYSIYICICVTHIACVYLETQVGCHFNNVKEIRKTDYRKNPKKSKKLKIESERGEKVDWDVRLKALG